MVFDYASYGYGSKLMETRDPALFVDQLILWTQTTYATTKTSTS